MINRAWRAPALSVVLGAMMFLYQYLTFRGFSNDHFLHVARGQQMLLGDLPIRDFLDPGMPLMYALSAAAQALFGRTLLTEAVLVFGLLGVAAALTCWIIVRLTGSLALAAAVTLLQILLRPDSPSYPKFLLYPVAAVAIYHYVGAPDTWRTVVLALVTVLSFLMRFDHGIFIGAGCLTAVIVTHWSGGRAQVLRSAGMYALTTASGLLPYFVYIQWAAGLVPYFADAIEFTRAESGHYPVVLPAFAFEPGTALTFERREATIHVRWAPSVGQRERDALEARFGLIADRPPEGRTRRYRIHDVSRPAIERIVRHPAVEDTGGIDRTLFSVDPDRFDDSCVVCISPGSGMHLHENAVAWLYYLTWAAVVAGGILVFTGRPGAPVLAAVTIMTALGASTFLRSILLARITDIWGLLPMLLGPAIAAAMRVPRWPVRAAGAVVLMVTVAGVLVIGETREELDWAALTGRTSLSGRFREVTDALARPQDALYRLGDQDALRRSAVAYVALCTRPSDRVLVLSFAPELFWMTGRGFAAGYATFVRGHHGSEAVQRLGLDRWRRQSVPYAIAFEEQYPEIEAAFPLIAEELRQRYSPVYRGEPQGDGGAIVVYAERDRPVEGSYEALGTPCFAQPERPRRGTEGDAVAGLDHVS